MMMMGSAEFYLSRCTMWPVHMDWWVEFKRLYRTAAWALCWQIYYFCRQTRA